jgi:hypothetical protein
MEVETSNAWGAIYAKEGVDYWKAQLAEHLFREMALREIKFTDAPRFEVDAEKVRLIFREITNGS